MPPDVTNPARPETDCPRPARDRQAVGDGDGDEPKPDEHEDLLVKKVDGQYALDGMSVHVAHLDDLEVTQRHRRKSTRAGAALQRRPTARDHVGDDVGAEQVVPGAEKDVEKEQLRDDVDDVEQLRRRVQADEIVAMPVADTEAEQTARQKVADAGAAAGPEAVLV